MLTRFKVNGFKNLVAVDLRFGPFTCIAGANGVGKSNLFDAIRYPPAKLMGLMESHLQGHGASLTEPIFDNLSSLATINDPFAALHFGSRRDF